MSIWIINDVVMNEEDDEAERKSLPTKQIKKIIQFPFQDVVSRPEGKFIVPSCSRWKHRGI